jgi:uncharacterized protein (DUF885 family)
MIRFSHRRRASLRVSAALAALALVACGAPAPPVPAPRVPDLIQRGGELERLVERYWAEIAALAPWYSWGGADLPAGAPAAEIIAPQSLADSLAIERRYLAAVQAMPRAALDLQSKLTYDIFRQERALAIEGFTYPLELLPINPYDGMPVEFALMAPGAERLALSSDDELAKWRSRSSSFVRWTQQAIFNMRDGMRRGYTVPRVVVEQTLPQLAALGEDAPTNAFYQAARPNPGDVEDAERTRLRSALTAELAQDILPAYRALHDFLEHEYLPQARSSVGLAALPLGAAWYAHLVQRATGAAANPAQLQATPSQLHALGLAEVQRLQQRLQAVLSEAAFAGGARGFLEQMRSDPRFTFKDSGDLLAATLALKARVADAVAVSFAAAPRAEFAIRGVEPFRQAFAPVLAYRPRAPNGLLAATLYVNPAPRDALPELSAQYLRAAVPGHHTQLELQRERADLPRFRRFGAAPAFVEGWGLYAATLGEELGLYHDPEAKFGSLLAQLNCALGLVIDTGLHAQGWTRKQALDYLQAQAPLDEAAAGSAVDRAIALPAEALACTVGFLKIQALRTLAQQTLGSSFELRAFHTEVIKDGAMPLDVLEGKIKSWLQSGATATAAGPAGNAGAAAATGSSAVTGVAGGAAGQEGAAAAASSPH